MGTQRYAQDRSEGYLPQTGNKSKGLTFGTEKEKARNGKTKGNSAGDSEIVESRIY